MTFYIGSDGPLADVEAHRSRIILCGNGLPVRGDAALCFDAEEDFRACAERLREWPKIEQILNTLEQMPEIRSHVDETSVETLQRHAVEQLEDKLQRCTQALGESEFTDEVQIRAMMGRPPLASIRGAVGLVGLDAARAGRRRPGAWLGQD